MSSDVRDELGIDQELLVTAVGSHDTASAVVGVPATGRNFGYVSCGTWALVGVELDAPGAHRRQPAGQLHQRARRRRHHPLPAQRHGAVAAVGVAALVEPARRRGRPAGRAPRAAADLPPGPRVDATDPALPRARATCPSRIVEACREAGEPVPESPPEVVRCILDSLAAALRRRPIDQAERLSGQPVEVVHIVGGGSQNTLLCQLTADACRRPVVAGPVEATALGNLLVQARTHGALTGDLRALRERVRRAATLTRYEPRAG